MGWGNEDKWAEKSQWTPCARRWEIRHRDVAWAQSELKTFPETHLTNLIAIHWLSKSFHCLYHRFDICSHATLLLFARNWNSQRHFWRWKSFSFRFFHGRFFFVLLCAKNNHKNFHTLEEYLTQFFTSIQSDFWSKLQRKMLWKLSRFDDWERLWTFTWNCAPQIKLKLNSFFQSWFGLRADKNKSRQLIEEIYEISS